MSIFNISEILQFAIRIEENGEKFYRTMSARLTEDDVKKLFATLAVQEVAHRAVFARMLEEAGSFPVAESYPDEYFSYLKAFVDNKVFDARALEPAAAAISSTLAAVDFAMDRELDSIAYYNEMRNIVPDRQKNGVDKIIAEEKKHYQLLAEIRRRYS